MMQLYNLRDFLVCAALSVCAAVGQQTTPEMLYQGGIAPSAELRELGGGGRWIASLPRLPAQPLNVRILETDAGRLLQNITDVEHRKISVLAGDPVRDRLAIGLENGAVALIDVRSGQQVWRVNPPPAPKNGSVGIAGLRFSSDGARLLGLMTVLLPSRLRLPKTEVTYLAWDASKGEVIESRKLEYGISSFSRNGRWMYGSVAMYHTPFKSVIVDVATGQTVGPELDGIIVAAHPDSHRALISSMGKAGFDGLRLVDVTTGSQIPADTSQSYWGDFSPDGRTLVLTGPAFGWRLIDAATGHTRFAGDWSLPYSNGSVLFSSDGLHFLAYNGAAQLVVDVDNPSHYRSASGNGLPIIRGDMKGAAEQFADSVGKFRGPSASNPAASFTRDGRWFIARSADGQLDFFDTATGNRMPFRIPTKVAPGVKQPPLSTASNGRYVYVRSEMKQKQQTLDERVTIPTLFWRKSVQVTPVSVEEGTFSFETVDTLTGKIVGAAEFKNVRCVSGGGEFVVELTTNKKGQEFALLKSAETGTIADLLQLGIDLSSGCSISNNGRYVVVASGNGKSLKSNGTAPSLGGGIYGGWVGMGNTTLEIYDVSARRTVGILQDTDGKPRKFPFSAASVRWTPDDRFLLGGGGGGLGMRSSPVRIFAAPTGRELHQVPVSGDSSPLEISSDGSVLLTATPGPPVPLPRFGVDVRDANTGAILYTLPDAEAEPDALVFSPGGKTIVGPDRSGALSVWNRTDGKLLGQLRALQEGEWLVTSPAGLFDGSPRAWSLISWHDSDQSLDVAADEIYFNEFYRPGMLRDLLDGRVAPPARTMTTIDRRQPSVTVSAVLNDGRSAAIRVTATEAPASPSHAKGSGVKDLRLFRNGQLIKAWRGVLPLDQHGSASFETTTPIASGRNMFTAYAFNSDNIKCADAGAELKAPGSPKPGIAYIITIGVNKYSNPEFNLKYAVSDAESMASELIKQQSGLRQFSAIESVTLRDAQATRANILLALSRLSGEAPGPLPAGAPDALQSLQTVQPEDTLVLYFAGHGIAAGDRFFLMPHDLGYSGARSETRANLPKILEHGISDQDLERALEPIGAGHMVMIIDACQSGQALESDDDRRGPMNSRGLAQLAWEKGISILAASQAYQAALESNRLGHGYLTFALAQEALKTAVADATPVDGLISESEWLEYAVRRVPQLQIEALEEARQTGRALVLEILPEGVTSSRLQSPRLFTRRDAFGEPLIVAKFK